ncbi:DUF7146 domain-containing protein [Maritalea mediterranea]|uniref:DUF7146 domain-containing protein n=1 Tax=Maritalea mediterranea TaxID=2909667 RepID=UPI003F70D8C3
MACPVCQPERRTDQRALSISKSGGRLLIYCHKSGCDFFKILAAAGFSNCKFTRPRLPEIRAAQRNHDKNKQARYEKAREIWSSSKPIGGTPGETYLRNRGITCQLPSSLRWAEKTYHGPSRRRLSAMIANVSTGGVHRTFFDPNGKQLNKMMLGPISGGIVRLAHGTQALAVSEGIETGLSLLCGPLYGSVAVWSALSASGLEKLRLPDMPGNLIVATDGDETGRSAGQKLAERASTLGWSVTIFSAPDNRDWNDEIRRESAAQ